MVDTTYLVDDVFSVESEEQEVDDKTLTKEGLDNLFNDSKTRRC